MKNKEKPNKPGWYGITMLSLAVLFLVSFSTSAWIYIKSNDLVFTDTVTEYEEKYKKITETEEKIEELEAQVERYKSMYEGAVKDNKLLSSTTSSQISTDRQENVNIKYVKEDKKETDERNFKEESEDKKDVKENEDEETDKREALKKDTDKKEDKKDKASDEKEED